MLKTPNDTDAATRKGSDNTHKKKNEQDDQNLAALKAAIENLRKKLDEPEDTHL